MSTIISKQNGRVSFRDSSDSVIPIEGSAQFSELLAPTLLVGASDAVTGFVLDAIPDNWVKTKGITTITAAHIGQGVTTLGSGAFYNCTSLASVTLPDSLTIISDGGYGNGAFDSCAALTSVTIPNSVTSIGDYAFYDCTSLTSLTIGNSVTSIGNYAFQNCTSLTSITIPDSVTTIGNYAFGYCSGLTSVVIENSGIGLGEFFYCTSLTSITIGNSVTSISNAAFQNCSSLTSADILVTKTIIDAATSIFQNTHTDLVLHVRASDGTWTAGTGLSIGGNASVDVIKDL